MLNDVTWRKMPIDILTNETMTYIESKMPAGYEYAPYMFYQAALRKADDDGCFDLEDGVIFKRLMRVDDIKIVWCVATLMAQRKMIIHCSPNSNKCLLADWDYPKGKEPRTWAERKQIVDRQIAEEIAHTSIADFKNGAEDDKSLVEEIPFNDVYGDKIGENVTQNVYGDKIQKNVTQNADGDKIGENVTQNQNTEREIERDRERESTHTQREIESLRGRERETKKDVFASAELLEGSATASTEKQKPLGQKQKTKTDKQKENPANSEQCIQKNNMPESKGKVLETQDCKNHANESTVEILEQFFIAQSLGYDQAKGHATVIKVAEKIAKASSADFPQEFLAKYATEVFLVMHNDAGPWQGIPLQPNMLLNDAVWAQVLSRIGQKIKAGKKKNEIIEKAKQAQLEAEADKENVINETRAEYEKFGINPDASNRFVLLLQAKAKESTSEKHEGDIF